MTLSQLDPGARLDWWRGATIYQIYPRSFMDANGDGIGDLAGIIERLPHVASLGVDAIWLSPFFTSPMKDFGYDVADYRDVDPMFGHLDDFKRLVSQAHQLGVRVIIDQVLSHSSDQHVWFQQSRKDRHNAKADWYVWADPLPDGNPPNNWMAAFSGRAWTFDAKRRQYYLHNFLASQPDLNFHHPEVRQAQLDNLRFWLDLGVDGFRFDVVNYYFHDRALTDNPAMPREGVNPGNPQSYQRMQHNIEQPENLAYLERIRDLLDEYPGTTSVGEIAGNDPLPTMAAYTAGQHRLHMAYTFDLLNSDGDARALYDVLTRFAEQGEDTWPCWALSNHDVERSATSWGESRALLALTVLCSLRGSLCLYQGEELGLPEAELAFEDLQDPFGINLWPEIKGRDGCRTPMVWGDSPDGGFSRRATKSGVEAEATPWLPVSPRQLPLSVAQQERRDDSFLSRARRLLRYRGTSQVLREGDQTLIAPERLPDDVFASVRQQGAQRLLCLAHLGAGDTPSVIDPSQLAPDITTWTAIEIAGVTATHTSHHPLSLMPGSAMWLALN
ncbi:alpha-amylase family glycosyl hydrolase [Cobetia sp. 10Alg 146]|uniref:alpha-amylase family glycosyl hydrolase n=1 Tax=Cobetia sp. 10Alg 146 TaxID=3040019 RepID=UPI00244A2C67|nr:alpha-amylase family glycosyl hydrolase [Cobetia sp. 10Alg 146]MDH2291521.1 alpha-amylase family glycosyl hydrolase [Cobetia sp. 10Alg 146]